MQATIVIAEKVSWRQPVFSLRHQILPRIVAILFLGRRVIDRDPPPRETAGPIRTRSFAWVIYSSACTNRQPGECRYDAQCHNAAGGKRSADFAGMPAVTDAGQHDPGRSLFDRDDRSEQRGQRPGELLILVAGQCTLPWPMRTTWRRRCVRRVGCQKLMRPAYAHFKNLAPKVNSGGQTQPGTQRDPRNIRDQNPTCESPLHAGF